MLGRVDGNRRRSRYRFLPWLGLLLMILSFVWSQLSPRRVAEPTRDVPAPTPEGPFSLVVLDPGHGGQDSGTIKNNLSEKDLTLDVALRVNRLLQLQGINILFTRVDDRYVSLVDRAALANAQRNCVFVSIHFDAAKPEATGVETYYATHSIPWLPFVKQASLESLNKESQSLASIIQESLAARTQAVNRGTSLQQFFVITNVRHPAVLVEGGFLTNADDLNKLASENYREQIAVAISDGVIRYRGNLQQQQTPLVLDLPDK
jgi:N-acetylmuramoyl-L-alanine amidase